LAIEEEEGAGAGVGVGAGAGAGSRNGPRSLLATTLDYILGDFYNLV